MFPILRAECTGDANSEQLTADFFEGLIGTGGSLCVDEIGRSKSDGQMVKVG